MKRFQGFRKILHHFFFVAGICLFLLPLGSLIRYHEAAKEYHKRVNPLIDRMLDPKPTAAEIADRDALLKVFHTQLTEEQFNENVGRINRALLANPTPEDIDGRFELFHDVSSLRFRMESRILRYNPDWMLFAGGALMCIGAFLQAKAKPKPTPPPTALPWDSTAPTPLAKRKSQS